MVYLISINKNNSSLNGKKLFRYYGDTIGFSTRQFVVIELLSIYVSVRMSHFKYNSIMSCQKWLRQNILLRLKYKIITLCTIAML